MDLLERISFRDFFYAVLSGTGGFYLTRNTVVKAFTGTAVSTSTFSSFMFYVYGGTGIVLLTLSVLFVRDMFNEW